MLWRVPDLHLVFDSGPVHDREDFVQVVEVSIHGRRRGIYLSTQLTVGEGLAVDDRAVGCVRAHDTIVGGMHEAVGI